MHIYRTESYQEMSQKAAGIISAQVTLKPTCVLGLATGSTPIGTYQYLVEWHKQSGLDFSQVKTVNLDEYKGLSPDDPQSYRYFMNHHLFSQVNIEMSNTHLPNGLTEDPQAECRRYEQVISALGGVDLQLLGIGHNGHIGFNEPDEAFAGETHCVALTESTIQANARLFARKEDVPRFAYTMGIKSIMQAKKILVVASGTDKAEIVRKMVCGPVTPQVPASILQFHKDVTLVGDKEALSLL